MKHSIIPFALSVFHCLCGCSEHEKGGDSKEPARAGKPHDHVSMGGTGARPGGTDQSEPGMAPIPVPDEGPAAGFQSGAGTSSDKYPPLVASGSTVPTDELPAHARMAYDVVASQMGRLKAGDPQLGHVFNKLWNGAVASLGAGPLGDEASSDVSEGRLLAEQVSEAISNREKLIAGIQAGELGLATNQPELEQMFLLLTLALGDSASGGRNLLRVIGDRADHLPPDRRDLAVFIIASQSFRELPSESSLTLTFDDLGRLASARNPVWRLLAVQLSAYAGNGEARMADADSQRDEDLARLSFYRNFIGETDPTVAAEAIRMASTMALTESRNVVNDIKTGFKGKVRE